MFSLQFTRQVEQECSAMIPIILTIYVNNFHSFFVFIIVNHFSAIFLEEIMFIYVSLVDSTYHCVIYIFVITKQQSLTYFITNLFTIVSVVIFTLFVNSILPIDHLQNNNPLRCLLMFWLFKINFFLQCSLNVSRYCNFSIYKWLFISTLILNYKCSFTLVPLPTYYMLKVFLHKWQGKTKNNLFLSRFIFYFLLIMYFLVCITFFYTKWWKKNPCERKWMKRKITKTLGLIKEEKNVRLLIKKMFETKIVINVDDWLGRFWRASSKFYPCGQGCQTLTAYCESCQCCRSECYNNFGKCSNQ